MADKGHQVANACPSGPPVSSYKPSGKKLSKKELNDRLTYAEAKEWSQAHKRHMSPLPLPEATERRIRQWFELVDDDGSGQLTRTELEFALKASGIPAESDAIHEIMNLFDYDHDGEIAWREFHDFLSHEVMADKDPMGSEYVLPSGTALPLGSMIGAIRRRKIINDVVEKGGRARNFWAAEGPEFLRYLLESEHFSFHQQGNSAIRDVVMRILAYKPPPSKEADPEAVEQHKRRIERLKMILMRTASSAGGAGASGKALLDKRRAGDGTGTRDSAKGGADNAAGSADSGGVAPEGDGLRRGGGGNGRPPVRFAAALAMIEAAVAEAAAEMASSQGQEQDAVGDAGGADGGGGDGVGSAEVAAGAASDDASALENALECVHQMRRLEEALDHHRHRSGVAKGRAGALQAQQKGYGGGGSRTSYQHSRHPVVIPLQVAVPTVASASMPPSSSAGATPKGPTGDGSGVGLDVGPDGRASWSASMVSAGSSSASSWVASACRRPTPPPARGATTDGVSPDAALVASASRRPLPAAFHRSQFTADGAGADESAASGGGNAWVAAGGRQTGSSRPSLEVQTSQPYPPDAADAAAGSYDGGVVGSGGFGNVPSAAATVAAVAAAMLGPAPQEGSCPHGGTNSAAWDEGLLVPSASGLSISGEAADAAATATAGGGKAAAAVASASCAEPGIQSPLPSCPQSAVVRVSAAPVIQRSFSVGRGPYSATLVRSARASSRALGSAGPRHGTGAGDASISGAASPSWEPPERGFRRSHQCSARASPNQTLAGEVLGNVLNGAPPSIDGAGPPPPAIPWTPSYSGGMERNQPLSASTPGGGSAAATAAAAAAAFRAAAQSPPLLPTPPAHGGGSGRTANGRMDAVGSPADACRTAWSSSLYGPQGAQPPPSPQPVHQQQHHHPSGAFPQRSTPASVCTSPAGSNRTSLAGSIFREPGGSQQPLSSGTAGGGGGGRLLYSAVNGGAVAALQQAAAAAASRHSIDLGECCTERFAARSAAAAPPAAAVTSAAAAAWLGAATAAPPAAASWSSSHAHLRIDVPGGASPRPVSSALTTPVAAAPSSPAVAYGAGMPQDPGKLAAAGAWNGAAAAASPSPTAASTPSPQLRGSAAALQPTGFRGLPGAAAGAGRGAPSAPAAAAATAAGILGHGSGASSRRSFESDPRQSGWRALRTPSAAAGAGPSAAKPEQGAASSTVGVDASGGGGGNGGWMRGRLMRTCLAAALRSTTPETHGSVPVPGSGAASSQSHSQSQAAGHGHHTRSSMSSSSGTPQVAEGSAGPSPSGLLRSESSRRSKLGGLLFSGSVVAKPGAAQMPGAVQGAGRGAQGRVVEGWAAHGAHGAAGAAAADTAAGAAAAEEEEEEAVQPAQPPSLAAIGVGCEPTPVGAGAPSSPTWLWPWRASMSGVGPAPAAAAAAASLRHEASGAHRAAASPAQPASAGAAVMVPQPPQAHVGASASAQAGSARPLQVKASALRPF